MNCRTLDRMTSVCGAMALLCFTATAKAQEAPEDVTPPPPSANSATDEQPPAQALPPCPTGEQAVAPAPPPPTPPPPSTHAEVHHNKIFAPQEISLTTGGGAANYFGTALGSTIDTGGAWDARVTFGAHSALALEAGYVGSTNTIDMANGANHGRLDSNGVDGDLRLQLPTMVQPYIFGGVGYNHMSVSATQSASVSNAGPLADSDNQVTVPAGGGLTAYIGKHTTVDLRGTYRYIPDNNLTEMSTRSLHQWVAQAHVGYVF